MLSSVSIIRPFSQPDEGYTAPFHHAYVVESIYSQSCAQKLGLVVPVVLYCRDDYLYLPPVVKGLTITEKAIIDSFK